MSRLRLDEIEAGFLSETARLRGLFLGAGLACPTCPLGQDGVVARATTEFCVLRLHDSWSRYCRSIVIASAAGAITSAGTRLPRTKGVRGFSSVPARLKAIEGGGRAWREPPWHVSARLVAAAYELSIANLLQVQAGVGLAQSPEPDLRRLRNFFAHYRADTGEKVATLCDDLGLARRTPPTVIPLQVAGGISRFEEWMNTLEYMAGVMAQ